MKPDLAEIRSYSKPHLHSLKTTLNSGHELNNLLTTNVFN